MIESNRQMLAKDESMIVCPSCGHSVSVEKAIEQKTEQRLREEFNQRFLQLKKGLDEEKKGLERERMEVKQLTSQTWDIIQEELKKERIRLAEQMKLEARKQMQEEIRRMQGALQEKEQENLTLQKKELEFIARQQQLENERDKLRLKLERDFIYRQQEMEKTIRSQYTRQQDFLRLEYEKKLTDQKNLIEEMTRKMEQGSMQMQGEVQEIAIENYLSENFPTDEVIDIKSGARGADCILNVCEFQAGQPAGRIYFESKRTKHFQHTWIEKFKGDMRAHKADLGILVTQVMPPDLEHMGQMDGVWICTFEDMKILVPILRESLIWIARISEHSKNQESKMALLYKYLISNEFRMQMEGIVEGFTQLQEELEKEKRAMHSIWKRREKQIEKVLINTNHMYGSIRGIAGNEIKSIQSLEIE
jgi:hypothetical protein